MIEKILENPEKFAIGAWAIGFSIYMIGCKALGFKNYKYVWTTTEFKRQFKKYQIAFNDEFKEKNKKMF
jgi:hypothetical protein